MTYFSLEVVSSESNFSVPLTEEDIIILFRDRFIQSYNTSEYTYNIFVRDFFESISYYQITGDNLHDKIGAFKKIFHKAYNILMQLERVCKEVFIGSFDNDEAKALVSRYNKETLRHWVLTKLRTLKNNVGKRKAWEDSKYSPLYDELAELAESNGLFEEGKATIKEFMLNLNTDGIPPVLHVNPEMTSHVAIFLGLLKQHSLIYGRYQKFIQDRRCLIGAGGSPVTSSTLSSSKNFYWYRFEDGDDLSKYQDTPVDSLIASFGSIYEDFVKNHAKKP